MYLLLYFPSMSDTANGSLPAGPLDTLTLSAFDFSKYLHRSLLRVIDLLFIYWAVIEQHKS